MGAEQITDSAYPVDVVLERRRKQSAPWAFVDWQAGGVVARRSARHAAPERRVVHEDEACQHILWTGFRIKLRKAAAAAYWSNLMADQPSVFVICRRDEVDDEPKPFLVTVDYDEIVDYQDVGDDVFRLPLPPDIYQWVERFLVNHCEPPKRSKRKRANWSEDGEKRPSGTKH